MLYRFKSQAAAELIMLHDDGEEMLRLLGKDITPKGVITVAQMPHAIHALNRAMHAMETPEATSQPETEIRLLDDAEDTVHLSQRLHPMVALLQASFAAGQDVVWGV
jgi:cyclopropane-fatty-acyl-phospholipid synthase